jgi:DNA-binding LacI/PurR family transcriptional regulator
VKFESVQESCYIGGMTTGSVEKSARLADVAKAAKVSQGTVSNVFNRPELVREEVREHVRSVANMLGYKGPDPKGRLLRAGKVNAIGVVTAEPISYFFTDPFARVLMEGIAEACDAQHAGISLVSAANEEDLAWNIRSALVDGFILFCIEGGERLVRLTRERQLPYVALALGVADDTIPAIGIDNIEGGRLAARHLTDLGHRRFGVLTLPFKEGGPVGRVIESELGTTVLATSRHRLQGYFEVLAAAGVDTTAVPVFETRNEEKSVRAGLEGMFASGARPTAILAQSDRIALIAMDWLRERGLSVPGDISVIGFDGIIESEHSDPPLTTIAQPMAGMGHMAVAEVLDYKGPVRRQVLPLKLVVRASTAPPKAQGRTRRPAVRTTGGAARSPRWSS